ncbi:hypothetical protein OX284_010970 [Flavobacterium sp. SUN046]|uniref:hypothetical protein n=1 Tax=Flavobacterium sp. SUN046 TaxID=3002440 RepID=UPI002DBF3C73|nr:hypothetical protein [Flavobacterium sp. SUN046]MEC4049952.1 hypothetical protein [Flavobacterium sp. SUN046]
MKKKSTLGTKKTVQSVLYFFLCLFSFLKAGAQVQNNTIIYISDDTGIFLSSNAGNFSFGGSSTSTTTRTSGHYGKLIFDSGITANGASNSNYLDGYARTVSTSSFIMPIGQSGIYAPVKVTPTTTDGVDGAYYSANPTIIGTAINAAITTVSSLEYWNIKGVLADAAISLSWRSSSDITTLTGSDLSNLTIAAWNGTEWTVIPSTLDTTSFLGGASTLTTGSITSNASVDLNTYSYFTLAYKGYICPPIVTSSGVTKTWNGSSWSPSSPTITDPAVINAPYNGSLACNSLVLNSNITLSNGEAVDIVYGVTGTGKIIMASEASVTQRDNTAPAPQIQLVKSTRTLRRDDYTYFGTPISGNFYAQLVNNATSTGNYTNILDGFYKYHSGPLAQGQMYFWDNLTAITTGKGYIAKVKNAGPFLNNYTYSDAINVSLNGTANNGDIPVSIITDPAHPEDEGSHNLLANPYPCAIDGNKFLTDNTSIDGVIYIWQSKTIPQGSTGNYVQSDYIAYTKAGVVYPIPGTIPNSFNGKIASDQGFVVLGLANNSTVTFTNCMRLTGNNNQFNKNSLSQITEESVKNRFKLNLTGDNGVFSQILIGYFPEASLGYDRMYDAGRNSVSSVQLFSILDNSNRELAINARPTFTTTDIVNLGVSKDTSNEESFTIDIQDQEGIFSGNAIPVILHDKLMGIYHDFANGSYSFNTNSESVLDRFEIVYQTAALSNSTYSNNSVFAVIKNNFLNINASLEMEKVELFDVTGRKIESYNTENRKSIFKPFYHAEGIYIAQIKFSDGTTASAKLINK